MIYRDLQNESNFPFRISDLTSKSNLKNKLLNDYLSNLNSYELLYEQAEEKFYLIT